MTSRPLHESAAFGADEASGVPRCVFSRPSGRDMTVCDGSGRKSDPTFCTGLLSPCVSVCFATVAVVRLTNEVSDGRYFADVVHTASFSLPRLVSFPSLDSLLYETNGSNGRLFTICHCSSTLRGSSRPSDVRFNPEFVRETPCRENMPWSPKFSFFVPIARC